jgi:hypothetical protein
MKDPVMVACSDGTAKVNTIVKQASTVIQRSFLLKQLGICNLSLACSLSYLLQLIKLSH